MYGFAILTGFQLLGFVLHRFGVPMPGPVIGLLLFAAALFTGVVKLEKVEAASSVLLRNMMLFFVPVIIAVGRLSAMLKQYWWPVAVSLVVSWLAVILTTGAVANALLARRARGKA